MKRHFCAVWRQAGKSKILVGRIRVKMFATSKVTAIYFKNSVSLVALASLFYKRLFIIIC